MSAWGAWSALLNSLTLPQGAGPDDARIVIGPDLPADLTAYYAADPIVAAILYYSAAGVAYSYDGLLTSGVRVIGTVLSGGSGVVETRRESHSGPNQNSVSWGFDAAHTVDVNFGANGGGGGGTVLVNCDGGLKIDSDNGNAILRLLSATVERVVTASTGVVHGTPGGIQSTANAAYQNLNTPAPWTFHKQYSDADTRLIATFGGTFFSSNAATGVEFGMQLNGTDHTIARLASTVTAGVRLPFWGCRPISGFGEGAITVQPRWRRTGAVANVNIDQFDDVYMIIEEKHT